MILQRYVDTYTGMYDFATSGGAIGSMDLGIPVPANSFIEFSVATAINIAAGAGCTISFDFINLSLNPVTTTIGVFLPATAFATFNPLAFISARFWGGAGITAPTSSQVPFSVGMSIAGNTITAGRIKVMVRVIGFDF